MRIYEYGDKNKPVILLLPGTMCYYKSNFSNVIEDLQNYFYVSVVSYTGFDELDNESYSTALNEIEQIEKYVKENYNNEILAAYGCSLGGSFVTHLVSRANIHIKFGIIGSSDMDQAIKLNAWIESNILVKLMYNFIHLGHFKSKFIQSKFSKEAKKDEYLSEFVKLIGCEKYDLSFITKESLKNQFYSDLITKFNQNIDNGETKIHVLYAKKMGKKYLKRYKKYFKNPIIHEFDLRHEELLVLNPKKWVNVIKNICI